MFPLLTLAEGFQVRERQGSLQDAVATIMILPREAEYSRAKRSLRHEKNEEIYPHGATIFTIGSILNQSMANLVYGCTTTGVPNTAKPNAKPQGDFLQARLDIFREVVAGNGLATA
jgi:hypothetical protein